MYEKNLLFRTHSRGLVYAAVFSVVLIGHVKRPTWGPKPYPPPPPPYLSPAPCQGYKRIGVGGGGAAVGHLLPPGPRPHSLTALTLHICQSLPVISDGPPFYREHAPVGALETETSPPLEQRSLGGGFQGEGPGLVGGGRGGGGGGWGEKSICGLKTPPLLGKNSTGRYTWSHPHFFPR
jgi:uncharacterized membrane protein YgcG